MTDQSIVQEKTKFLQMFAHRTCNSFIYYQDEKIMQQMIKYSGMPLVGEMV